MKKYFFCLLLSFVYFSSFSQKNTCETIDIMSPDSLILYPIDYIVTHCGEEKGIAKIEHLMFYEINKIRKENNLPLVKLNNELAKAAHEHAVNMCLRNFFSHVDPKLGDDIKRAKKAGFTGKEVSENIASGAYSVEDIFNDGWMKSSGHRENILNPNWNVVGMGYYQLTTKKNDGSWKYINRLVNFFGKISN